MKIFFFTVFNFTFILSGFAQGLMDGFYKGQGNGTVVLGLGFEDSKKYFAGREKIDLSRNLIYANVFGAYGITKNMDVQISVPYLISDDNKDFQDLGVFLKYRFYQSASEKGGIQLSLGAGISTPLTNYPIGDLNDLGQQATIIESRFVIHYQYNSNWFTTIQSGFSYKLEEVPNSFPLTLKVGKAVTNWYFDTYYTYQYSFGGTDYLGAPRPQNFKEFGVDYHKIGGSVYKSVANDIGVYLNLSYLLTGRNSFQGAAYGLGMVYNF